MIRQIIKYSILISFIIALGLWILKQDTSGLGLVLGSLWGCLNLYLIEVLIKELLIKKNTLIISGLTLIKFPFLYWIIYKILNFEEVNPWFFIIGLSLIFIVAFIKALSPMHKRLT